MTTMPSPKNKKTDARRGVRKKPRTAETVTSTGGKGPFKVVQFSLPRAYTRVLDEETKILGLPSRGYLIMLLLKHRRGQVAIQRAGGPSYEDVTREDLREIEIYRWHTTDEGSDLFDECRREIGAPPPGWFLVILLNQWLGLGADGFEGVLRKRELQKAGGG